MCKRVFLCAAWIGLCLFLKNGSACEPCLSTLTLQETARAADLIITGRKVAQYPPKGMGAVFGGPDWIRVEVYDVLKGQEQRDSIKINSYNGMCGYGVVINDEEVYIMFLQKAQNNMVDYDSVNGGCAVKSLLIKNGLVAYNDSMVAMDIITVMIDEALMPPNP